MKAGSMGIAAAFSFYPGKNLGACGEAGAVTTNDAALAAKCKMIRDHGQAKKYYHAIEGYNGRLDAIQAGFLRVKLKHLANWNQSRRQAAERYGKLLGQMEGVIAPFEPSWSRPVYHLYVVRTPRPATSSASTLPKRALIRGSTIPSRCTCRTPTNTWATAKETFQSLSGPALKSCPSRCTLTCRPSNSAR